MQFCAVLALLGAVALCPAAQGRSAVIGLSGDDTRHGIAVLYGNLGGNQVELSRYHADTLIQTRFARTAIEVEIRNNGAATNTTVPFAIPENAMLVTFEIDDSNGKVHQARPMLRDALVIDTTSTSSKIQARNVEAFDVDIELAGSGSVVLRVVYEELLTRQREKYTNVQQIWPGQTVADLKLTVRIKESSPINSVNFTFSTESANSVVTTLVDQLMSVVNVSDSEVLLTLQPTVRQQQELASSLGQDPEVGAAGQFNVMYDVARYPTAGDIVVRDGFFAHFFAPSQLQAIPKYALFLLDVSGSMQGRKIQQLSDAMVTILGQLGADDVFTVIEFSDGNTMWDLGYLPAPTAGASTTPVPASPCNIYSSQYISEAQQRASYMSAGGGTAMLGGLQQAIACAGSNVAGREPILVMLTDGIPNESTGQILNETAAANSRNGDPNDLVTSIFTMALGNDADIGFLRELALRNGGKFAQIYESGDASVQLQDFYKSISLPLLTDVTVTFNYQQAVKESVTQKDFRTYFWGSELVVAGRIMPGQGDVLSGLVTATGYGGQNITYPIQVTAQPSWQPESLGGQANSERLWAFLFTKQHLDQEVLDGPTSAAAKASIDMALLYSFVTPHTCVAVDIINPYIAPTIPPQPTTASPARPTTPPAPSSPTIPTSPSPPPRPSTSVGPPTPPTPGNSERNNIINIGSISVGSMTVNGPLIQFNLRR